MSWMRRFAGVVLSLLLVIADLAGQSETERRALLEQPLGVAKRLIPHDQIIANCSEVLQAGGRATPTERQEALLLRAESFWAIGKLNEAKVDVESVLRLKPDDIRAKRYLVQLQYIETNNPSSILEFQKLYPNDCWANIAAAECMLRHRPKEALPFAKKARALARDDTDEMGLALWMLASAYSQLADDTHAIAAANECMQRISFLMQSMDVSDLYMLRAGINYRQKRYQAAEADAEAAYRMNGSNAAALFMLWNCQVATSQPETSLLVAQKYREAFKSDSQGVGIFAVSCNLTGRHRDVLELPENASIPLLTMQKGLAHLLSGDESKALSELKSSLEADPNNALCLFAYTLTAASAQSQDAEAIAGLVPNVNVIGTETRLSLLLTAVLDARNGNFEKAEQKIDRLLTLRQLTPGYTKDLKNLKTMYAKRKTARLPNAIVAITAVVLSE